MEYVGEFERILLNLLAISQSSRSGNEKFCLKNFVVNFKNECVRLSRITFVAERFGLFALRHPPFPRGMDLGSGITFDILPMFCTGHFFEIYYK